MASAFFRVLFPAACSGALLVGAAWAVPAAAQFQSEGYQFLESVKDREGDIATAFLKEPGSVVVNTRDITSGETALHIVARRRDTVWIRFLTQNGANPNIRDKKGETPLQIATIVGPLESVTALLRAGANVDDTNAAGETPLISAVHRRDVPMARLLLGEGANPDRNDNSGRSARDYAELQTSNTLMLNEFSRADEARADASTGKTYGPSF